MNRLLTRMLHPTGWLVALSALLGVALVWQFQPFVAGDAVSSQRWAVSNSSSPSVLPDFRIGVDAPLYADMVDRPLYSPTRMLAPAQVVIAAPEPAKPSIRRGLYELVGVADLGDVRVAQVREAATRRTISVREGDTLQEMQVTRVDRDRAVLTFQGETDELRLPSFTPTGRVPQPIAPALVPVPAALPVVQASATQATTAMPTPLPTPVIAAAPTPSPVASNDEIRRLEAAFAANPNNWNRSQLYAARGQFGN